MGYIRLLDTYVKHPPKIQTSSPDILQLLPPGLMLNVHALICEEKDSKGDDEGYALTTRRACFGLVTTPQNEGSISDNSSYKSVTNTTPNQTSIKLQKTQQRPN